MTKLRHAYLLLLSLFASVLAGCVQPVTTPTATVLGPPPQTITLEAPPAGATISSPLVLRGATGAIPIDRKLTYRIFDSAGSLVGSGIMVVIGPNGSPGRFDATVTYQGSVAGEGRIEVLDINPTDGSIRATASVTVSLSATRPAVQTPAAGTPAPVVVVTPGVGIPTPLPAGAGQSITIESPPNGTLVGSPVTLTGRVAQAPAGAQLSYKVRDAAGTQIGQGNLPIQPGGTFVGSLLFTEPPGGGAISIELSDPGHSTAVIGLNVAPRQAITIDTPSAGTFVGSPMTITGRTARYPFQGTLGYRVVDGSGRQLGSGLVGVQGGPGQPGSFAAELNFTLPPTGGDVRIDLSDEDAVSKVVAASQSLTVRVAPPAVTATIPVFTPIVIPATLVPGVTPITTSQPPVQLGVITIESPGPSATVGSPVSVAGRISVTPASGQLRVRVRDAAGRLLGENLIGVAGTSGQPGQFNGSLTFALPEKDGPIVLEVVDLDLSGVVRSSALVIVQVTRPTPYPGP